MTATLQRRLGAVDATVLGLGAMVGAGVFAAFTPAAQAAGSGLLIGLLVAALVAFANAASSAQLAAVYPIAGGTYVYGRERLGHWWGFSAGWCFLIGKTASCAAMAMTFAEYAVDSPWQRPVAIAAVVVVAAVNLAGITRTALATRVILVVVVSVLAVVIASAVAGGGAGMTSEPLLAASGPFGVLQAAGLLFFAFAGYARIATMGEEVRDPARTIPRAILGAFAIAVVLYAVVAVALLISLGPAGLAASPDPLAAAVTANGWAWAAPAVRIAAAAASLGALLALMAGIGRTVLAMAREGDLPRLLAAVHAGRSVPHRAEILLAAVVVIIVAFADLRGAIGFSSFAVLLYYFVANVAALTQPRSDRRYPRALSAFGAAGCLALVAALPWQSTVAGLVVLFLGIALRLLARRVWTPNTSTSA